MKMFAAQPLRYDKNRIFNRLKITPDRENDYEYANEIFPRLEAIVQTETELLCGYRVLPNNRKLNCPELDGCEKLAVCLVGCSERINKAIAQLLEDGDLLEGYILNDLANDNLFNA
jgi:hypothetical protein